MADTDFKFLEEILPEDTLSEGREKLNAIVGRVNDGKFDNVFVRGDINVDGRLFVSEIIAEETETVRTELPVFTLYDTETGSLSDTDKDRGIAFKYAQEGQGELSIGFFGWAGYGNPESQVDKFKFIPNVTRIAGGGIYEGAKGVIDAKIEASDILNPQNIATLLITEGDVVTLSTIQTVSGAKIFSGRVRLEASDQGNSAESDALTARRRIITTDGILISLGGLSGFGNSANLIVDRTLALDSTVVRTDTRPQTILGTKTFSRVVVSDEILGTASSVVDGVYTTPVSQTILGSKVFRQNTNQDGIRLFPQNLGSSDFTFTITTGSALTGNRTLTLANANIHLVSGTMVSTTVDQSIESEKTFTKNIFFANSETEKRGIKGVVSGGDFWFVGGKADSIDSGYVEISTGADGQEAIYARQYTGSPLTGTITKTFVILSTDGHTESPGYIKLGQQASSTDQAVRADRRIFAGEGLFGGGLLSTDVSLSLDSSTLVNLSSDQTITGTKTFTQKILGTSLKASTLETPRKINGVDFDGSSDIILSAAFDGIFYESLNTVQRDYVVPTDKNSMAVGPITIPDGITITVSTGSVFTII